MNVSTLERTDGPAGPSATAEGGLVENGEAAEMYLAECRAVVIEQIRSFVRDTSARDEQAHRLMLDYPLRRAKGLRPALCVAVCRALGGSLAEVLPSAAVLELYHNAFLIHDDIEDGSLERRGGPALHQTHGVPLALNCGDGLLALTLEPLLRNTALLGVSRALQIMDVYASMVVESFEGQAQELRWIDEGLWSLSDADYESMVRKKTCVYSFVAPAQVGAVVAKASREVQKRLTPFFQSVGLAFQIQDDILNLEDPGAAYGKELAGDLWEGKRTLMLLHALRNATVDERQRALAILRRPRPTASSLAATLEGVVRDMKADGVIDDATQQAISAYLRQRAGIGGEKTEDDVRFLRGLIEKQRSIPHARAVASEHARAADAAWQELQPVLGDNAHSRFIGWLKDYVVQRNW